MVFVKSIVVFFNGSSIGMMRCLRLALKNINTNSAINAKYQAHFNAGWLKI